MKEQYSREAMLFGEDGVEALRASRVAVFGLGGVGGAALEALARAGIGTIDIIDADTVSVSNKNRQLIALDSTVGKLKTEAWKDRIYDIDPDTAVNVHNVFFLPENADSFDFSAYDYIVDAIDTVSGKLAIITKANSAGVAVISSMGTGNKTDPGKLKVADIYKTSVCPLARVMRYELRRRDIKHLKVVYSEEEPKKASVQSESGDTRKSIPGSCSFVPPVAGYLIAAEVINDLLKNAKGDKKHEQ